jgi:hypothetical protein
MPNVPFHSRCLELSRATAIILAAASVLPHVLGSEFPEDPTAWPAATATTKPWTRWWWLGSAVDPDNLTRELQDFAEIGIGGVEICPIYQAVGAEDRSLDFLSGNWMDMLSHTTREAQRLGLGVDMTTGTGWPFGGPQVTPDIASATLNVVRKKASGGSPVVMDLPEGRLECLRAHSPSGDPIDLQSMTVRGRLEWTPPPGDWEIIGLMTKSPIQQVKRAAPGGTGSVLDPFSESAMAKYLKTFESAFADFQAPMPRAQFHDSFEYYGAEWTPDFLASFQKARGYDLRSQLPAFAGIGNDDTVARVRSDYRETLGELHLKYLKRWHDWTKSHGGITRNQAHGSPGNLLDHYAVSEIPETEIFRHVDEKQIPMMRLAASAAHSNGGKLVSAEAFTWLDEHFQVTPEQLKEASDFIFLSGVNHLFFHGIPYSPRDVEWPGWLFYASTHMGRNGGLWRNLSAFTAYLQRCQSILQEGTASSEVLIYYPIYDLWHNHQEKLPLFTLHNQNEWLWPTPLFDTSMELWNHGITFDYASDAMLSKLTVHEGQIIHGGHSYRALILPGVKKMTPETLKTVLNLSRKGARIVMQDGWPEHSPGYHRNEERTQEIAALATSAKDLPQILEAGDSILETLGQLGVLREKMGESGLRFVRRIHAEGYHYFIVNRSGKTFRGNLPLAVRFKSAVILDPWKPDETFVTHPSDSGIALHLEPGASILIRTFTDRVVTGKKPPTPQRDVQDIPLAGPWKIEFIEGGPALPASVAETQPSSWKLLPGTEGFSGTARYSTSFELPAGTLGSASIDLGRVANTARVSLNGSRVGISWCAPHLIDIRRFIKPGKNLLEVEVTNLAANRIADLDRRKVPWKRFHEINFVNKDYKSFDASSWPAADSGLLGPVRLRLGRQ